MVWVIFNVRLKSNELSLLLYANIRIITSVIITENGNLNTSKSFIDYIIVKRAKCKI